MRVITDLHIHSKYSRATSKNLDIQSLEKYGKIKGLNLIGTGDFTHPVWLKELKESLTEENGLLKTKTGFNFILQAEISNIYSETEKVRKIHHVLLAPSFEVVDQINELLDKKGNLMADGRPIFGKYPSYQLVEDLKSISDKIEIIPAHIWTPWFSLFGANSGFNTIKDCYRDQLKHIYALETGLSSDPAMNWRLSQLDKYTLVSNSDSHSFWPWRLGRESNVIEMKQLSYDNVIKALRTKEGFVETIEVDPNFGKYHYTGHRKCNIVVGPEESAKMNKICPVCRRQMTVGVMERVEELADRKDGFKPSNAIPFKSLISLSDILSAFLGTGVATQKVSKEYNQLVKDDISEFNILLDLSFDELKKLTDERIAAAIIQNREGKVKIKPGYDGVYGVPMIGEVKEEKIKPVKAGAQKGLEDFYR